MYFPLRFVLYDVPYSSLFFHHICFRAPLFTGFTYSKTKSTRLSFIKYIFTQTEIKNILYLQSYTFWGLYGPGGECLIFFLKLLYYKAEEHKNKK